MQEKFTIFFRTPKLQNKKFTMSKISNNKFRKIHYFANIKYRRNILVKGKIFAKKNSIKKICKKKFSYKNFTKKKSKKILKIMLAIFLYLKKNSVEIRLIFEKKNRKKF